MTPQSLRNHRGFFSDYWLGTLIGARVAVGPRLTPAQARRAMERISRLIEAVSAATSPDLTRFRERFARPLLTEYLGFDLLENPEEPRLRPISVANGSGEVGVPLGIVYLCPDPEELESRHGRRQLEDALLARNLDYGFLLSPEVLRLIRRPGLGGRGAAFDLALATAIELQDAESLAVAYRVLAAPSFVAAEGGARPIDALEAESRRHSTKVSTDLKTAVFEAAECIVSGFLEDVRDRPTEFTPLPSLPALRDAGFLALYRILFILYAEARDERLIRHRFYQRSYSLDSITGSLLGRLPGSLASNRHGLWFHIQAVFRIFNEGIAPNLPDLENIPPRGGRLFSETTDEGKLLRRLRLGDQRIAAIILGLATTQPRRGVGRERVSFRELEIEQLGSVYEGLLEFEPAEAGETLIECKVGGREMALAPEALVQLAELKSLTVRGDASILIDTAAARLHPDAGVDEVNDEDSSDAAADVDDEEEEEEDDSAAAPLSRGATLRLVRRLQPGAFFFKPGSARKASGSYYTPTGMVNDLVRHALGPLVTGRSTAEIERLRVIDIACGSGHFLVGAARFLGPSLLEAYRREYRGDPPPAFYPDRPLSADVRSRWEAEGEAWCKRRIVERCLFGVDLNPDAVQLAQVALWIESLAGDRPLSFFAHHIRCGNSLLGSWLDGYDTAPDPQLGQRRGGTTRGLFEAELRRRLDEALTERRLIDAPLPPEVRLDTPQEYAYKEDRLRRAEVATREARLLLDLRSACPLLPVIWRELPALMGVPDLDAHATGEPWWPKFEAIRARERFFHWELEFPEVFLEPERPGFDAVLGNPPWDKVLPSKQEFYGGFDPLIPAFKGSDLDQRIRALTARMPKLTQEFEAYRERATTIARVLRGCGDFPLAEARSQSAHEDLSKYFVDRALRLVAQEGAAGLVVPSVFYNGDGWVGIRRYLLDSTSIERFYGFENRREIFPIHRSYKFVNLVARKEVAVSPSLTVAFMRHDIAELESSESKPWEVCITREEITRISPETLAFLEYRNPRERDIVRAMHVGRPLLGGSGPGNWGARFVFWRAHEVTFNATEDRDLFTDPRSGKLYSPDLVLGHKSGNFTDSLELMRERGFWPVFEGKHIDQFLVGTKPIRWWISLEQARTKYGQEPRPEETLVFRDIARNTDERTCIAAVIPEASVASYTLTALITSRVSASSAATVLNSFCFDFLLRLRSAGTHVSQTYIQPVPVPPAEVTNNLPAIITRYSWNDGLSHIADDEKLWPTLWDTNKAVAQAYGLGAADLAYVLGTFPGFARKRPEFHGFLVARLAEWEAESQ